MAFYMVYNTIIIKIEDMAIVRYGNKLTRGGNNHEHEIEKQVEKDSDRSAGCMSAVGTGGASTRGIR